MKRIFTLALILMAFFCVKPIQAADFGGTVSANTTLTQANSPYNITSNVTVNAGVTLTIESGVEIRFGSNMYFVVRGTMNATGVTFTANTASPSAGFYDGIYVSYQGYPDIGEVNLDGCTVEYARQLHVRNGSLNLTGCTLQNFSGYGVDVYNKGILNITNTTITGATYPIYFRDTNGGNFSSGGGNLLTGNSNDFVFINFRDIDESFRMYDMGIPYYYDSELRITDSGTLVIDPGVQVQGNTGAFINVNGRISAVGEENNPILFTTRTGNTYWLGLNVNNSAIDLDCVFRNCIFENATYNHRPYSAMGIFDASPTIDSCYFRNNAYNVEIQGRSLPGFSNNSFGASNQTGANAYSINTDLNAEPTFTNDTLHFNNTEARAIGILGNNVVNNGHLKQLDFVGINNITYLLVSDVTITETGSLAIDAGVVIKTNDHSYDLIANGALTGIGTAEAPIVFTHRNDDNYGNPADTYNNGGGAAIAHSNAGRIMLNSSALSTLDNWHIRYAGYSSGYYGVYVRNNNVITNSTISNSYRAVYFAEDAQIINNVFEDIDYYPVTRYVNEGSPALISNTINNANTNAINIAGFATDTVTLAPMDFAGYGQVAYLIESDKAIPSNAIVNVAPGTVFKFNGSARLTVNGGLSAIGTGSNKVVFTSIHDDSAAGDTNLNGTASAPAAGNWHGIFFNDGSLDNINKLEFCDIRYLYYGLTINNCFVDMLSSTMNFSTTNGLLIYGSANPNVANNQFYNLGAEPIHMDMFASPVFSGNTVANVPRMGISLNGQTVSGTVPVRNFAGIDTITYVINEHMTVNDHLIIPAGLTFKSNTDRRWYVNGRLDVQGTADAPVVFTSYQDDAYGNPRDLEGNGLGTQYERGSHIYFYDGSNDNSTINYAIFRYSEDIAIRCINASPTIQNTRFEQFNRSGILLSGISTPTINNCTFHNIAYPLQTSLTSFPAAHSGNVISGSTGKGIRVSDETQTQDVTVSKKNFAGITNIPYIMGNYTIGTGSVVTVDPGVVFKFLQYGSLNVYKGLLTLGNAGEKVVFTANTDDFYGGDTYNDGDASLPNRWHWYGIHFYNEAIDAQCQMEHSIIRHASYNAGSNSRGAVTVNNSSPTLTDCLFDNNLYGIVSRNTSQPVINNCDFINFDPNSGFSIYNLTTANNINAINCWWGDATGPYHATLNASGLGKVVSDGVTFSPWNTILGSPILGDVSLNGEIKPYDASLVLQHTVGNITLSATQQGVADVSGDASISSYDASLILQYSIGLITDFNNVPPPAAALKSTGPKGLSITGTDVQVTSSLFDVTLQLTTSMDEDIRGIDIKLASNPSHIKLISVEGSDLPGDIMIANGYNSSSGEISLSMASAHKLNFDRTNVNLRFEMLDDNIPSSVIELMSASANEASTIIPLDIEVVSPISTSVDLPQGVDKLNVWHNNNVLYLDIATVNALPNSTVTVTDLSGKNIHQFVIEDIESGIHSFNLPISSDAGSSGIYLITIRNNDFTVTRKISVK
ncbi:Por secretion system C-terminal sorting domain-containing protein [Saccharicrinis carchari]|uniref:Por secretion system C-terminal sorting domain-containing protein n=1 Tax=Saccharicrinis carchari TaxID=1168039 RepID=A0A521DPW3_SACCC|nr:T9SS type A sorting domain-containing protein [Saccharicrinis carchari]SMO72960.1 Por secretion system C-terminal sorting domain-containing protein [Saccharicrinis carchari]